MIFQRSLTVEVEHRGHVLTFRRPRGSTVLSWIGRAAELEAGFRKLAKDKSSVLPVDADSYAQMLVDLSDHLHRIDGTETSPGVYTRDRLDEELQPGDVLALWYGLFQRCQMGPDDLGKSAPPSESPSRRTETAGGKTTAPPAGTSGAAH